MKKLFYQKELRKAPKGKDGKVVEQKNVYAQRSSGNILPEYRPLRKLNGNTLLLRCRAENIIFIKDRRNILGLVVSTVPRQRPLEPKQGNGDYGGIALV
jgi:hypothetical protein